MFTSRKSGKILHRISPVRPFTKNSECLAVYIVLVAVNASAHHCMPLKKYIENFSTYVLVVTIVSY